MSHAISRSLGKASVGLSSGPFVTNQVESKLILHHVYNSPGVKIGSLSELNLFLVFFFVTINALTILISIQ